MSTSGFSSLLLLLTAPLFGIAALAVRLDSPGPIFYKQERVGKGRKPFTMYKFRSMRENAESGGARWAAEKDPRVTRVGRLLRLTHIDELPQIWNVFRGDMSVIGPRPERPEFVRMLEETVPYYAVRHAVRPGITGWAQVTYRYGASIEDAVRKLECGPLLRKEHVPFSRPQDHAQDYRGGLSHGWGKMKALKWRRGTFGGL